MKRCNKGFTKFLLLTLFLLILSGCAKQEKKEEETEVFNYSGLTFDELLQRMFVEDVTEDVTLFTQMIENPADYQITNVPQGLAPITKDAYDRETEQCVARQTALLSYPYDTLTNSQKQDYDLIMELLEDRINAKDLFYYQEPLSTLEGVHIMAPAILGLHTTRYFQNLSALNQTDIDSIKEYFTIYDAFGAYLKQVAQFEREKAEEGLFMSEQSASAVIKKCREVIDHEAKEFTDGFSEEISQFINLTEDQRNELIATNQRLAKEEICAGYQEIIDALKDCSKKDNIGVPLYKTPEGNRYYSYLLKQKSSSDDSVEDTILIIDRYLEQWRTRKEEIEKEQPNIQIEINQACTMSDEELLASLDQGRKKDLPELPLTWGLAQMPKQCEGFAMGLYYASALDSTQASQNVYVGGNATKGSSYYIETVGHEGAPGHLYHYNYMKKLPLSDYRKLFGWCSYTGYLEGWTTYIEQYVYEYAGLTKLQAEYLMLNRLLELGLIQRMDIGVNYEGWDYDQIGAFLKDYPEYIILAGYLKDNVEQSPCTSSSYVMGWIKLTQIKEMVRAKMGDSFTDLKFHQLYLDQGPADYMTLSHLLK